MFYTDVTQKIYDNIPCCDKKDCCEIEVNFDENTGPRGYSAYEVAVRNGFVGTEEEWLESLEYQHSEEFTNLAEQVRNDAENSRRNAENAGLFATEARQSESNASYSEINAKESELKAKEYAESIGFDVENAIQKHNTSETAHSDIRLLITNLTEKINTFLNSDDVNLDQLQEIVDFIKKNESDISKITADKVNIKDIINNLTTNVSDKPLSAAMGVELKRLIDNIKTYTKLSELTDDAEHRTVTDKEKQNWNSKLGQSDLQSGIDKALEQAKASGEFKGEKGDAGISPIVKVTPIENGNKVTITDAQGENTFDVKNGTIGKDGVSGATFTPKTEEVQDGVSLSWENDRQLPNPNPVTIKNGKEGKSGKSAYQSAVENGFKGTEDEWLKSLKGEDGKSGIYLGSKPVPKGTIVQIDPENNGTLIIPDVLQELGQNTEDTVSQKRITDEFNKISTKIEGGLVDVDAELKEYMTVVKPRIAQAIRAKGGNAADKDAFGTYPQKIMEIPNNILPTENLPEQTVLTATDNPLGIQLKWGDIKADGYSLLKKEITPPQNTIDGVQIYNGKDFSFLDSNIQNDVEYFYRIYPYNSKGQVQALPRKSIVSFIKKDRSGQKKVGELNIGDTIVFGNYKKKPLLWELRDTLDLQQRGFVSICTKSYLLSGQFDAPENSSEHPNPNNQIKSYGSARWSTSNIRQWLNSDGLANSWFIPQTQYDVCSNNYKGLDGFLNSFNEYERNLILDKKNKCYLVEADGGGFETVQDKIWLASSYEMGLSLGYREGDHIFNGFETQEQRKFETNYWLRTINDINNPSNVRNVQGSGSLGGNYTYNGCGVRPFCQISGGLYVKWDESLQAYVFSDDMTKAIN